MGPKMLLRRRACLRRAVRAPVRAFVAGEDDDAGSRPVGGSLTLAALRTTCRDRPAAHLEQVLGLAVSHGVESILYLDLERSDGIPAELMAWLARRYRANVLNHHRSLLSLKRVGEILLDAGVPWLTMKGSALAEAFYRRPDVRRYADVDILIDPSAFPAAIAAFLQHGGQVLEHDWRMMVRERRGQLNLRLDTGVRLDAHWHVVFEGVKRDHFAISTNDLIARRVHTKIGPMLIPTLSPSDALAHVGLHAALAGGGKLAWLLDIAEIARHPALSWPLLVSRLRQWRARAIVGLALARAAAVVGAPVPDPVLEELRPSRPLRAVDGLLTAALPLRHHEFSPHPSLLHLRLARSTTVASLRAVSQSARMRAASQSAARWLAPAPRDHSDVLGEERDRWLRDDYLSRVAAGELDVCGSASTA